MDATPGRKRSEKKSFFSYFRPHEQQEVPSPKHLKHPRMAQLVVEEQSEEHSSSLNHKDLTIVSEEAKYSSGMDPKKVQHSDE